MSLFVYRRSKHFLMLSLIFWIIIYSNMFKLTCCINLNKLSTNNEIDNHEDSNYYISNSDESSITQDDIDMFYDFVYKKGRFKSISKNIIHVKY